MGYSCAIHCRNKDLQQKMLKFLKKNYRRPEEVLGLEGRADSSNPSDNLSYEDNKLCLGFDFCCMPEDVSHYVWSVLVWMSFKVGRRRWFNKLNATVPFVVYDGGNDKDDFWPRLLKSEWEDKVPKAFQYCLVDDLGFSSIVGKIYTLRQKVGLRMLIGRGLKKQDKLVRDELFRLNELWEKS